MIKIKEDIKWLYRINFFLAVLIILVGVIEVPNFRSMVDNQIHDMEDYNYATHRIKHIEADNRNITKRINLLSQLMELKQKRLGYYGRN